MAIDIPPRFKPGDRVRAINRHPHGHTREPGYVRGHIGVIHHTMASMCSPIATPKGRTRDGISTACDSRRPRSGARAQEGSAVYVDLWEDYLERPDEGSPMPHDDSQHCPATRKAQFSMNRGRPRRLPWPCACPKQAISPGPNGRRSWAQKSRRRRPRGDPDLGKTYYQHWLNALERMCVPRNWSGAGICASARGSGGGPISTRRMASRSTFRLAFKNNRSEG